ncbi:MAG: hypothetical protein HQK63_02020 [Desulfamplus sp.]|nr:hypothetical protein [Desulfamplus sp.]
MNVKSKCDACELKGYSPELCKFHIRNMAKSHHDNLLDHNRQNKMDCSHYRESSILKYGKTAAVGAGVGLVAVCGSMAVIPSVALKALFGHVAAVKVSGCAGGGVAGAGINIFRKTKTEHDISIKKELKKKSSKRRKHFYFPLPITGGDLNG